MTLADQRNMTEERETMKSLQEQLKGKARHIQELEVSSPIIFLFFFSLIVWFVVFHLLLYLLLFVLESLYLLMNKVN